MSRRTSETPEPELQESSAQSTSTDEQTIIGDKTASASSLLDETSGKVDTKDKDPDTGVTSETADEKPECLKFWESLNRQTINKKKNIENLEGEIKELELKKKQREDKERETGNFMSRV